jgi:hypothetical protein
MPDCSHPTGLFARRRAERQRRALDKRAVREEFELERPPGLVAKLKAYAAGVEELERARVHASLWVSLPRPVSPQADVAPPAEHTVRASRARQPRQAPDPRF